VTADPELAAKAGVDTDPELAETGGLDVDPDLNDVADMDVEPDLADVAFLDVDAELEELEILEGDEAETEADAEDLTGETDLAEAAEVPADTTDDTETAEDGTVPAASADGATTAAAAEDSEDEAFVYGDDDEDLPAAQVAVAGATSDPVKDYLKQIGKVPLLNAEQEVELAKRIEAGLFAEEKLAETSSSLRLRRGWTWSGSLTMAGGRRITCSRPTSGWWYRWPSATPAAGCCSWT
jgi:hypothetical protein